MSCSSEPRTLAEMHARKRAADERQAEAARRLVQRRLVDEARAERAAAERRREVERRRAEERARLAAVVQEILPPALLQEEPKAVIRRVAEEHGLTYSDIVGPRCFEHIVAARWRAIAALAEARPDMSLTAIARHLGGRDHTTILHALRRIHGPDYRHRPGAPGTRNSRIQP